MNEIQKSLNILGSTLVGGALALSKGLKKKESKGDSKENKPEEESNSIKFPFDMSSEEAVEQANIYANDLVKQKARAKRLRDIKNENFNKEAK